jgi:WD40 repeat protein
VLTGHEKYVTSVAVSRDSRRIVSGSYDGAIRVWDSTTGAEVKTIGHTNPVRSVEFSPDGCQIVSGSDDGILRVWDAILGTEVLEMSGHNGAVLSAHFSPDGCRIVSGSNDTTVRVWDTTTGCEALPTIRGHGSRVTSVAFSPDGTGIVSGSWDGTVRVWDAQTGATVIPALHKHTHAVQSVNYSPDGRMIVSGSWDKTIRVWDLLTAVQVSELRGHDGFVNSVTFSLDGQQIISGSSDKTIRVWDVTTGSQISELRGHEKSITSVCCSHGKRQIISSSRDATIRIWDIMSDANEVLPPLRGHDEQVNCVAFSPDGCQVVSGSSDKSVRIWNAATGTEVSKLGYGDDVRWLSFFPDGHRIFYHETKDDTFHILDATTGYETVTFVPSIGGPFLAPVISPDGCRIAAATLSSVWVWDSGSGAELFGWDLEDWGIVQSLAFSADGSRLVVKSSDETRSFGAETGRIINSVVESENSSPDFIKMGDDGWIVDAATGKTIFQLPPLVSLSCHAIHKTSLAVGTRTGGLLIIDFPLGLFMQDDSSDEEEICEKHDASDDYDALIDISTRLD